MAAKKAPTRALSSQSMAARKIRILDRDVSSLKHMVRDTHMAVIEASQFPRSAVAERLRGGAKPGDILPGRSKRAIMMKQSSTAAALTPAKIGALLTEKTDASSRERKVDAPRGHEHVAAETDAQSGREHAPVKSDISLSHEPREKNFRHGHGAKTAEPGAKQHIYTSLSHEQQGAKQVYTSLDHVHGAMRANARPGHAHGASKAEGALKPKQGEAAQPHATPRRGFAAKLHSAKALDEQVSPHAESHGRWSKLRRWLRSDDGRRTLWRSMLYITKGHGQKLEMAQLARGVAAKSFTPALWAKRPADGESARWWTLDAAEPAGAPQLKTKSGSRAKLVGGAPSARRPSTTGAAYHRPATTGATHRYAVGGAVDGDMPARPFTSSSAPRTAPVGPDGRPPWANHWQDQSRHGRHVEL